MTRQDSSQHNAHVIHYAAFRMTPEAMRIARAEGVESLIARADLQDAEDAIQRARIAYIQSGAYARDEKARRRESIFWLSTVVVTAYLFLILISVK